MCSLTDKFNWFSVKMHLIDYEWNMSARLAREIKSKKLTSE